MAAVAAILLILLCSAPAVLGADDGTTHLHFFMHDVVAGTNPTAVQIIKGPGAGASTSTGTSFGDTTVMDDLLTETSSPTSSPVGRMQGVYMRSSQQSDGGAAAMTVSANILLTSGEYNGSTLAVMGRDDTAADVREVSVIGGTGKFRMASGYVLWKTAAMNGPDGTFELDVYLGNGTTIDASAPVSPVDGGGSSSDGGSSGAGAKSSSGGVRMTSAGSGSGWVVGVAAAVAGSWWLW